MTSPDTVFQQEQQVHTATDSDAGNGDFFDQLSRDPDMNVLNKKNLMVDAEGDFDSVASSLGEGITTRLEDQGLDQKTREALVEMKNILDSTLGKYDKLVALARQVGKNPKDFITWLNSTADTTFIKNKGSAGISTVNRIVEKIKLIG